MKRTLGLWMVALAAAGCGGPDITDGTIGRKPPSATLDKVGLQVYWEATAKDLGMSGSEQLHAIYRLADNIYCLTSANRLIALDGATGVARWAVTVGEAGERVYRPVLVPNMSMMEKIPGAMEIVAPKGAPLPLFDAVVINSSSTAMVIDRKNGKVVRRVSLDYGASCAGACDGPLFYAGTARGWYYAVSLEQALKVWTLNTTNSIDQPMEYFGGAVYVASGDGKIISARASRTAEVLHYKTLGGPASAPFYVDARGCFVPGSDNALYAFTADLTLKLWDHPFSCAGPLRHAVQVGEKTVFQRAEGDKLYAINLVDGQPRWSMPEGLQVLGAIGSDVYVRAAGGQLLQVDEILGATKASATLGGFNVFLGNTTEPMIVAGTNTGRVVCLKPFSAGNVSPSLLKQVNK